MVAPGTAGTCRRWWSGSAPASSTPNGELDRRALRNLIFSDPHCAARPGGHSASADPRRHGTAAPRRRRALPRHGHSLARRRRRARDRVDRILVVDVDEARAAAARSWRATAARSEQARAILAAQASRASAPRSRGRCAREHGNRRGIATGGRSPARALLAAGANIALRRRHLT